MISNPPMAPVEEGCPGGLRIVGVGSVGAIVAARAEPREIRAKRRAMAGPGVGGWEYNECVARLYTARAGPFPQVAGIN